MRGIDHQYVIDVNAHWEGNKKVTRPDCVMMRDPATSFALVHIAGASIVGQCCRGCWTGVSNSWKKSGR